MTESDPLGRFVAAEIGTGRMPGASWWVGDAHTTLSRGAAGDATIEPKREAASEQTPFDLASLTKPLATALLAIILESEGRLRLDEPLGELFPVLRRSPFAAATLRDAATHKAGLPAWKPLYLASETADGYIAAIGACEPVTPRTTHYSDLGYVLLGLAVERCGGAALDALFEQRIASPLGLARCGFPGRSERFADAAATERGNAYERGIAGTAGASYPFRTDLIRGFVHDGNAWALGGVAGHAGLFGTASDVASIAKAILDPSLLGLPQGAFDAMLRRAVDEPGGRTLGFLKADDTESVRGVLPAGAVGHFGFTGTSIWIDPVQPRVDVFLTNRVHPVVPAGEFTATRRGFHALAAAL